MDCLPKWSDPLGILSAPFGVGPALHHGSRMLKANLGAVMVLTLVFSLPNTLVAFALSFDGPETTNRALTEVRINNGLDLFIGIVCSIACLILFIGTAEGRRLTIGQVLVEATSRYGRVFAVYVRAVLWIVLLGLAFILPGIWKAVLIAFAAAAAVRIRRGDPLEYSTSLVEGRWWLVFGSLVAVFAIGYLPAIVLTAVPEGAITFSGLELTPWPRVGLSFLGYWVMRFAEQFVGACCLAMFYALVRSKGLVLEPMRWRDVPPPTAE